MSKNKFMKQKTLKEQFNEIAPDDEIAFLLNHKESVAKIELNDDETFITFDDDEESVQLYEPFGNEYNIYRLLNLIFEQSEVNFV